MSKQNDTIVALNLSKGDYAGGFSPLGLAWAFYIGSYRYVVSMSRLYYYEVTGNVDPDQRVYAEWARS